MKRKASAVWRCDLKSGKGSISTESGVLKETQYSFSTRFENGIGTNPEELIGAAHAGCFSMAFSMILGGAGFTPDKIETTATITLKGSGDPAEFRSFLVPRRDFTIDHESWHVTGLGGTGRPPPRCSPAMADTARGRAASTSRR